MELGQWQIGSAFLESEVGRVAVVVGHHRSLVRLLARSRSVRGLRRRRRSVVGELQFNWKVKLERICESPCTFPVEHSSMNLGECLHLSMPTMPTRRRTPSAGTETGYLHFPIPNRANGAVSESKRKTATHAFYGFYHYKFMKNAYRDGRREKL